MKFFVKIKKVVLAAIAFSMILSSTCVTSHAATVHRQNEHDTHIANTNTTLDNGIMPLSNSYTMGATNTFTSINVSLGLLVEYSPYPFPVFYLVNTGWIS